MSNPDDSDNNRPMQGPGGLGGPEFDAFFKETYGDLRALARERLRHHQRGTFLDTTALVHESYLRFAAAKRIHIEDRGHFLRHAARVMRWVIVDFVRERRADRRGGDAKAITLTTNIAEEFADAGVIAGEEEILGVHEALEELARRDDRLVQVVEMRYFGGMKETEIATALNITDRTVRRDWEKARLLLADALGATPGASA